MTFPSPQVFSWTGCEGQNCRTVRSLNMPIELQGQKSLLTLGWIENICIFFVLPQVVENLEKT